jgi:hypothetical protein
MSLPNSDFLGTIVSVSATFIGFSLVVGFLRADDAVVGGRLQSMRAVAELAMIAGGGALLPLLIAQFDVSNELTWRIASMGLALGWSAGWIAAVRRFRRFYASMGYALTSIRTLVFRNTVPIAILLLLWNAVAPSELSAARYSTALVIALIVSAERFVFATFQSSGDDIA